MSHKQIKQILIEAVKHFEQGYYAAGMAGIQQAINELDKDKLKGK